MENEKRIKIIPCKYCKRGRIKVHNTNSIGSQITADKCVYCDGKGFVRMEKYLNNTDNNNPSRNKQNGILDKK